MEDQIRRLCTQILATNKDEEIGPLLVELRQALHRHIEGIRARLGNYPFVVERRVRNGNSPLRTATPQEAVNQANTKIGRPKAVSTKAVTN
jgi:hypothetical protein